MFFCSFLFEPPVVEYVDDAFMADEAPVDTAILLFFSSLTLEGIFVLAPDFTVDEDGIDSLATEPVD